MKFQAVSVCINYADYLRCVVENHKHFDRWVIITVESDEATQELCVRYKLKCHVSNLLGPDGVEFNAAYCKSAVINEGLALLDHDCWAVVLDCDILLPRHFRRRLEAQPLEAGCVYGLKGRRVCSDRYTFGLLRDSEPWEAALQRNTQPLGYCHIFSLQGSPNRYPELSRDRGRTHDDDQFIEKFPEMNRRVLPFSCLHAGPTAMNWNARVTENYLCGLGNQEKNGLASALVNLFRDQLLENAAAAMIGYFPGTLLESLAKHCNRLYLVDNFRIQRTSVNAEVEADRAVLRACLGEMDLGEKVVCLDVNSETTINRVPEKCLDVLYISGGFNSPFQTLAGSLPIWLSKLKNGGIVCGDMFAHAVWPNGIAVITSLLGSPSYITGTGFWVKRFDEECLVSGVRKTNKAAVGGEGVCIVNTEWEDLEPLLLSIHSTREFWNGPIAVYHWGEDEDQLRIACKRFECSLYRMGPAALGISLKGKEVSSIAAIQPFENALVLTSGMLFCGQASRVFRDTHVATILPSQSPVLLRPDGTIQSIRRVRHPDGSITSHSGEIVIPEGERSVWGGLTWEVWTNRKISMLSEMVCHVRVPEDASIVFIVDSEALGDLQQQWAAFRFVPAAHILLVVVNVAPADVWLPGDVSPDAILFMSGYDVGEILTSILQECMGKRLLFLAPTFSALPCADLFSSREWEGYNVVYHSSVMAMEEPEITGNHFAPVHFTGIVSSEYLRTLIADDERSLKLAPDVSSFMHVALFRNREHTATVDLGRYGIVIPVAYRYLNRRQVRAFVLCEVLCIDAELGKR